MTRRQSYQQGYVSKPIPTRCGTVFKIRYRVKSADGKWNQKAETLYGLSGKKAARAVLEERIRGASFAKPEGSDLNLRAFVDAWWKPYLQRKGVKPSTRRNYDSILELHILPVFGELRIDEVVPLHVERFIQTKVESGLSGKTVRNLLLVLQGIMSLALDNDLIDRSPIRNRHKPTVDKHEKPTWSPAQLLGLADPEEIGIIGFSRSCFYVMKTLTTGSLHLKAASITDGWMASYFQYMQWPDAYSNETNATIGAAPFGEGLQQWLKRSPEFNLDKVTTPLQVVATGLPTLLEMWGPYAGLRYLKKPVDLIILNTDEHILTNPAVRMASQGGSVDWFRFWLQNFEDADPKKAEQYKRWRELRKPQEERKR